MTNGATMYSIQTSGAIFNIPTSPGVPNGIAPIPITQTISAPAHDNKSASTLRLQLGRPECGVLVVSVLLLLALM
jgi:hypothetical protein